MCGGFQIFRQGIELVFPEGAVRVDPSGGVLHGLGRQTAAVDTAVDFALEESRGFEHAQVLGNRWQGNVEGLGQFRDGGLAPGQPCEDGAAGGIGQSAKGGIQRGVCGSKRIVNHTV
jgi:hypothetical protein